MKVLVCRLAILCVALGICSSYSVAQSASSYDALIRKGKTALQAGSTDLALATGKKAIKLDARRWEGYALAGGALMNLKRYDEAITRFGDAIERAPQDKQAGLSELRKQCFAAESGTAPQPVPASPAPMRSSSAPEATTTQAEIVLWKSIENSTNPADFRTYLSQYPNGAFAALAQRHLDDAKAQAEAAQQAVAQQEAAQKKTILQVAILSGAKSTNFQGQEAIGFAAALYCRQALLYGQVDVCATGQILVTDKNVGFQTDKGEIRFLSPRTATTIKDEGGREGDTFSIYDDRGNRYRFGNQKFDSPYVTFLQASLSDFSTAHKELADQNSNQGDVALWDSIKDSSDPAGFQSYLAKYPGGQFATQAKSRLAGDQSAVWQDAGAGLWWTRSDNGANISIDQGLAYCAQLRLLGDSDWRVPTLDELKKVHNGFTHRINSEFQLSNGTGYLLSSTHKGVKYRIYQEATKGIGFRVLCVRNAQ